MILHVCMDLHDLGRAVCVLCMNAYDIQVYSFVAARSGDNTFQYQNDGSDLQWEYLGV